ncbi:hypothetical protein KTD13_01845 [Burkholderia multivorans]|nr:hypothetical protein [Burkholderia multivorans]
MAWYQLASIALLICSIAVGVGTLFLPIHLTHWFFEFRKDLYQNFLTSRADTPGYNLPGKPSSKTLPSAPDEFYKPRRTTTTHKWPE